VGIRGVAELTKVDKERLNRFVSKYLGSDSAKRNDRFMTNIVGTLNIMAQVIPKSIVANDVSFFKAGPELAG
jgi:hypothetical protein